MLKSRKAQGFSLVELMVAVIVIALLAAVAMPNFVSAMQKAESASVKGSMKTVQVAVENYLCSTDGSYPLDCSNGPSGCGPYFPGGSNAVGGQSGAYPVNTITGAAGTQPISAGLTSASMLQAQRTLPGGSTPFPGGAGVTSYDCVDAGNSYAICGGDSSGHYFSGVGGTCLVLSND